MNPDIVQDILDKHSQEGNGLISILEDIQARFSYLPEEALKMVAESKNIPLVDVYGVATFYKAFSLVPRGKHLICACLGTACHVRGGPIIVKEFESQLGIKAGETTPDKEFTLETVACLGACALGPIVVVDGHYFSNVGQTEVKGIIEKAAEGFETADLEQDYHIFPVEVSCPKCNHSLMDPSRIIDDYPSIRVTASFGRNHGWLTISSMYGSYKVFSEYEIPKETVVHFFCPHCHAELKGATNCVLCGAPMIPMIVSGGGMVQICSRKGCKNHMLDLSGVNL
jgi:NADH-quinone oxidoreductase subunit E